MPWYKRWFNEDYLALYPHRNQTEADLQVDQLLSLGLLPKGPLDILDLGCGAGRHLLAFSTRGHRVVGLDSSAVLLEIAKAQVPQATLLRRDLHDLQGLGPFDLVTSFFTSLGYFPTPEEDAQVLTAVESVLKPGGLFLLDYLHPDEVRRNLQLRDERQVAGKLVQIEKRIEGDLVIKEIHFPDAYYEERVRLYSRQQLEAMLSAVQLQLVAIYDNLSGKPWSETGERQILIARKSI